MHELGHVATTAAAMKRAGAKPGQLLTDEIGSMIVIERDIVNRGAYIYAFPPNATYQEIRSQIMAELSERALDKGEFISECLAKLYFGKGTSPVAHKVSEYILDILGVL